MLTLATWRLSVIAIPLPDHGSMTLRRELARVHSPPPPAHRSPVVPTAGAGTAPGPGSHGSAPSRTRGGHAGRGSASPAPPRAARRAGLRRPAPPPPPYRPPRPRAVAPGYPRPP